MAKFVTLRVKAVSLIDGLVQPAHQIRKTPMNSGDEFGVRLGQPSRHPHLRIILTHGNDPAVVQRLPIPVLSPCGFRPHLQQKIEE
jgi:hypothetical protein